MTSDRKSELFVSEDVLQTWRTRSIFFEIRPQNGVFYALSRLACLGGIIAARDSERGAPRSEN